MGGGRRGEPGLTTSTGAARVSGRSAQGGAPAARFDPSALEHRKTTRAAREDLTITGGRASTSPRDMRSPPQKAGEDGWRNGKRATPRVPNQRPGSGGGLHLGRRRRAGTRLGGSGCRSLRTSSRGPPEPPGRGTERPIDCNSDPQTGVAPGVTRGRNVRSNEQSGTGALRPSHPPARIGELGPSGHRTSPPRPPCRVTQQIGRAHV